MSKRGLLLGLLVLSQSVLSASLSSQEEKMRAYTSSHTAAQITLLKKLVKINSGTLNVKGVIKIGDIVRQQLNELGFKTHWVKEPARMHRAPTLIAERKGKKGKTILLIGHLDTVFSSDSSFRNFKQQKQSIKAPGVIDAKGGLVVLIYALKALQAAHALDMPLMIVLTGDEEDAGKPTTISRKPLLAAAKRSDVALDFEPAVTLETATIARRGISNWTLTVQGKEAHSAGIFREKVGAGAIFEASRILTTLREQWQNEKNLSFNPGIFLGGTTLQYNDKTAQGNAFGKQNVVAKTALVKGDFRFIDDAQKKTFENALTKIVSANLPGTHATVTFQDAIPSMPPTENNLQLLKKYSEVSIALGYGPVTALPPNLRGAGDISHVARIVPFNLSGLGPVGKGAHTANETLELNSLSIQTARAALLIYRLSQ